MHLTWMQQVRNRLFPRGNIVVAETLVPRFVVTFVVGLGIEVGIGIVGDPLRSDRFIGLFQLFFVVKAHVTSIRRHTAPLAFAPAAKFGVATCRRWLDDPEFVTGLADVSFHSRTIGSFR